MRQLLQYLIAAALVAALIVVGQLAEPLLFDDSPAAAITHPLPRNDTGRDEAGSLLNPWSLTLEAIDGVQEEWGPAFDKARQFSVGAAQSFEDDVLRELLIRRVGQFKVFKDELARGYDLPGPLGADLGLKLRAEKQKVFVEYRF